MGEGEGGGEQQLNYPPHLNPPPPWGEEVFYFSILLGFGIWDLNRRK